jgi:hypothetical protein
MDTSPSSVDMQLLRESLRRFFPEANGRLLSAKVCMFTNTPDEHFIIDFHPRHPQVRISKSEGDVTLKDYEQIHGSDYLPNLGDMHSEHCRIEKGLPPYE